MKLSIFLFTFLLATVAAKAHDHHAPLDPGGREGLHGMVLYGSGGVYFLDHIPMEHAPHDFQIVVQVALLDQNGKNINANFSNSAFTLKPDASFSLNDYIAGKITQFSGDIYSGGFEQGGKVLKGFAEVQVKAQKVLHARQIPSQSGKWSLTFSDATNDYEVNVITPQSNFQSITNKTTGKEVWCVKGPEFFEPCEN